LKFERALVASVFLLAVFSVRGESAQSRPSFYRDVLPILEQHCQGCHRSGEIAPFSLVTYGDSKPWAQEILQAIQDHKMPPWFADPCCGHFANDPSLSSREIETITNWVKAGAPAGDEKDAPAHPRWTAGWNIAPPDLLLKMPRPVRLPATGDVEYTYEIVPTNFAEGKWVETAELRPSARNHVPHAEIYVRPP
jgi:hypothetical protein